MIKSLKEFFTRFWDVMSGDGWEDPEVLYSNYHNPNSKGYLEISKNSKESKKFIIFAFFFQLIIFIIVQAMEIITTRREIQNIK